jgi:hypothetical protein
MGCWSTGILVVVSLSTAITITFLLPAPGISIAVLAAFAALMSLRPDMGMLEKATWMVIIGLLLMTEVRSIRADRAANDARYLSDRRAQDAAFQTVLQAERESVQTSLSGFSSQADKTQRLLQQEISNSELGRQSLSNITGGNSFAVVLPNVVTGGDEIPLFIKNRGQNVLTGVNVLITTSGILIRMTQDEILSAAGRRDSFGALHPGESIILSQRLQPSPNTPNREIVRFYVMTGAQNFTTEEFLNLRKIGKNTSGTDSWEYSYKIYKKLPPHYYKPGEKPIPDPLLEESSWNTVADPMLVAPTAGSTTRQPSLP